MKKILIAGKDSYIGKSFKNYIEKSSNGCVVEEMDTYNFNCETYDFNGIDTIICVAGIAHIKETKKNKDLYYKVNRDLTVAIAKRAKEHGVRQFIFLSSMSVYGKNSGVITPQTKPNPKSFYGESKLQAEKILCSLQSENFKIVILRAPMVYGKDCKGNFQSVVKIANKTPVFPKINNLRSMVYIDNLCEFIKLCVSEERDGLFFPQNKKYVTTTNIVKIIAEKRKRKIFFSRILGFAVYLFRPFTPVLCKAFGSLIYTETEKDNFSYCVVDEINSFKRSV